MRSKTEMRGWIVAVVSDQEHDQYHYINIYADPDDNPNVHLAIYEDELVIVAGQNNRIIHVARDDR